MSAFAMRVITHAAIAVRCCGRAAHGRSGILRRKIGRVPGNAIDGFLALLGDHSELELALLDVKKPRPRRLPASKQLDPCDNWLWFSPRRLWREISVDQTYVSSSRRLSGPTSRRFKRRNHSTSQSAGKATPGRDTRPWPDTALCKTVPISATASRPGCLSLPP